METFLAAKGWGDLMSGTGKLDDLSIKVRNYRCFGQEPQGFDHLCLINVIIGRNNVGKSALLDAIAAAVPPHAQLVGGHSGKEPEVAFSYPLPDYALAGVFSSSSSVGRYGRLAAESVGKRIEFKGVGFLGGWRQEAVGVLEDPTTELTREGAALLNRMGDPLASHRFLRLSAERNVEPEPAWPATGAPPTMQANGRGCTQLAFAYLHRSTYDRSKVERTLLEELNRVLSPDFQFSRISVRQNESTENWETYLETGKGQQVSLSSSGSGIKTIFQILILFHLMPEVAQAQLGSCVFGLEEIENNLHPATLRRLLGLLREKATKSGCRIFLTTHSSAMIDFFRGDPVAQIVHVTHDGASAEVKRIEGYSDGRRVLDELDVRASDLLQANGVVWVEGPSDRIAISKAVEMWSEGRLREGAHFQCLFTGGRVLAHFSAADPDEHREAVAVLTLNRNCAILMDRDRGSLAEPLDATKRRISEEVARCGGLTWVTAGRELENYYPPTILESLFPGIAGSIADEFCDVPRIVEKTAGKRCDKVDLARKVGDLLTREALKERLDLADRLDNLCAAISRWNGLPWERTVT